MSFVSVPSTGFVRNKINIFAKYLPFATAWWWWYIEIDYIQGYSFSFCGVKSRTITKFKLSEVRPPLPNNRRLCWKNAVAEIRVHILWSQEEIAFICRHVVLDGPLVRYLAHYDYRACPYMATANSQLANMVTRGDLTKLYLRIKSPNKPYFLLVRYYKKWGESYFTLFSTLLIQLHSIQIIYFRL